MDHDFYWLFSHFWWLIFPLFWMVAMMARLWSRHSRANRAWTSSRAMRPGQGTAAELLKTLQQGSTIAATVAVDAAGARRRSGWAASSCLPPWPALSASWPSGRRMMASGIPHVFGLVFVTAIMVACAVSNLLSFMFQPRQLPRLMTKMERVSDRIGCRTGLGAPRPGRFGRRFRASGSHPSAGTARLPRRLTANHADADDLAQETFVFAWNISRASTLVPILSGPFAPGCSASPGANIAKASAAGSGA